MIYLITGLPGHGKTYFTIAKAQEVIGTSGRPVFYSGIPELKLPWTESDPKRWNELDDGSVMIIDESQRVFPVPPVGTPRGVHVTALETHRHRGLDLWLITQDANLLDSHVRRLVGVHYHVHRPFGMPFVNVLQWDGVHNPRDYHDKQKAVTSKFTLSEKVWSQYKSATVHTVKMRIPWKLVVLVLGLIAVPVLGFTVWKITRGLSGDAQARSKESRGVSPSDGLPSAPRPRSEGALGVPPKASSPLSAEDYWAQFVPRVKGEAWTAPRYDELTRPQVTPAVTMCFAVWDGSAPVCECKAQNGAALAVDGEWCLAVIKRGLPFRDFAVYAPPSAAVGEGGSGPGSVPPMIPAGRAAGKSHPIQAGGSSPEMPMPFGSAARS